MDIACSPKAESPAVHALDHGQQLDDANRSQQEKTADSTQKKRMHPA